MYHCPQEAIDLLDKFYRQVIKIDVHTADDDFTLTEENVLQGGLTIDRYCASGQKIEIGSAVAAELTLQIKNDDGQFDNVKFEGAELYVQIGVKKWDAHRWENAQIHWIPCGYFIVDTPPRTLSTITLSALDRMIRFSRPVTERDLTFPMEAETLINKCCEKCGIVCATDLTKLTNGRYVIQEFPTTNDELTYRTLIGWLAELTGTCAYIDWNGQLRFEWYTDSGQEYDPSRRYSSDLYENDIHITGVSYTSGDSDKKQYLAGTDDYAFDISGNGLVQSAFQDVVDTLYVLRKDFVYRPYSASVKASPYLWPLDMIHFTDKSGTDHLTIVSHVTFTMNEATEIKGVGETAQNDSYAVSGLTANQQRILENMNRNQTKALESREQALIALNEMIGGSLGLYYTEIKSDNDTPLRYFHNAAELKDSNIIYTFGANGFAWTDDWNDGDPTWQYGFTKDGNAVYNALSAYKISAEYIEAHTITADLLSTEYLAKQENDLAEIRTSIQQLPESILLEVSKTYATTDSLNAYTKTNEIRSKFAMDASSVTIESGLVAFKSGTITIDSTNFKLDSVGNVTARGQFTSVGDSSTTSMSNGSIQLKTGDKTASITIGGSGSETSLMANLPGGRIYLSADTGVSLQGGEIHLNSDSLYVHASKGGAAFAGVDGQKWYITSVRSEPITFTYMADFRLEGNNYVWNEYTRTINSFTGYSSSALSFEHGILIGG